MVLGAAALAWVGSGLPSHSWAATVAVALPIAGIFALAMRWPNTPTAAPARVRLAMTCWLLLVTAGLLWEAAAFFRQPAWNVANPDFPTLSVLLDPALEHRFVRFLGWLLWLYAGARLTRPAPGSTPNHQPPA